MMDLWYMQYKYNGRWYEVAYALASGLYEDEAREILSQRFVPEVFKTMRFWKSGYADKAICVTGPRRIQARHVRD